MTQQIQTPRAMLEAAKIVPLVDTLCFDLDALTEVQRCHGFNQKSDSSHMCVVGNVWLFIGARQTGAALCI